jgi:hypothetical protein
MGRMARSTTLLSISIRPVVEISGQARPARERVADRLGDGRFAGDGGELGPEPRLHRIEDRLGLGLADGLPCWRREAPDIALDGVEGADAHERLGRDRRRARRLDVEELSSHMRPAERERDRAAFGKRLVGAIAIDLEDSGEAGQMRDWPFMFAIGLIDIGDAGELRPPQRRSSRA